MQRPSELSNLRLWHTWPSRSPCWRGLASGAMPILGGDQALMLMTTHLWLLTNK